MCLTIILKPIVYKEHRQIRDDSVLLGRCGSSRAGAAGRARRAVVKLMSWCPTERWCSCGAGGVGWMIMGKVCPVRFVLVVGEK